MFAEGLKIFVKGVGGGAGEVGGVDDDDDRRAASRSCENGFLERRAKLF
jgi:hypothetical protein